MNTPTPSSAAVAVHAAKPRRWAGFNRPRFLQALRKFHGWIGLWGALLDLLFGTSGILLNHRAVMKIPAVRMQESSVQLPLPAPAPSDADALAAWLQQQLGIDRPANRVREEPARPVAWGDKTLQQPARWQVSFNALRYSVQAEYWLGSGMVSVKRSDGNFFALLINLHKGNGLGVAWVLLADTLAGSIVLLSLTGVLLWTGLQRRRVVGALIFGASLGATILTVGPSI